MKPHIAFVGAGAVGGYTGGRLALSGQDVTLIDPWTQHIDAIKANGLRLSGTQGEAVAKVRALHIGEVQSLIRKPVDIAIIASKSFDTEWSTTLIKPYLSSRGYVVSMQNGMNEDRIAAIVGWGRTVGCVLSTIGVYCDEPAHARRYQEPGAGKHVVFRVGEAHGKTTERAKALAEILNAVDTAGVIPNLWEERWSKLISNSISHGVLGATGLGYDSVYFTRGKAQRLGVRIAAEGIKIGREQGFNIDAVFRIPPDIWLKADRGDEGALTEVENGMRSWLKRTVEAVGGSVQRDVLRGRRSEIEFTNGLIAQRAKELGFEAPINQAMVDIIRRIDSGELKPSEKNLDMVSFSG